MGPAGYEAPGWSVAGGASVDIQGVLSDGDATLTFQWPAWGATVQLTAAGDSSLSGTLTAYDKDGGQLAESSAGEEVTLPRYTWTLELTVTSQSPGGPDASPELRLEGIGTAEGPVTQVFGGGLQSVTA